jgi:fucose permease
MSTINKPSMVANAGEKHLDTGSPKVLVVAPAAANTTNQGMFVTSDGRNVLVTFMLVSSLFLLWGFCNGMIDVMDKHFQEELHLSLSQSAWVQFAHWMGYFLMALPAGWLAARLGYRGGIIAGLLLVAVGGLWFIPATNIAAFWAFLLGVCIVASGLTFLETVANPYTTVLGPTRYAATRINLAQSCNGVGWILGPIAGGLFFYSKDATGRSTGSETLWIPYVGVAIVVLLLAVVFYFAPVPDIKAEDDYHVEDSDGVVTRHRNSGLVYALLLGNVTILLCILGMILWLVLGSLGVGSKLLGLWSGVPYARGMISTAESALLATLAAGACVAVATAAMLLRRQTWRILPESIWSQAHFSGATLAQFFYVAAQAGIFSFLINYMTAEPPGLPQAWRTPVTEQWVEVRTAFSGSDFKDVPSLASKLRSRADPLSAYLATNLSSSTLETLNRYEAGSASATGVRVAMMQDLNSVILKQRLYSVERFHGVVLQEQTRQLLSEDPEHRNEPRLNRLLLADAYPKELAFADRVLAVTNRGAANLASLGFIFFLFGRVTGAALLRRFSAHTIVGLYGLLNVAACFLVFLKLGWISVVCVFLSYFFMSIMFPTIFALGIFGLGERAKRASAYIVMSIVGGAILPKLMGAVADHYDMSRGFIVPMFCFAVIAIYGYAWTRLSGAESLHSVSDRHA